MYTIYKFVRGLRVRNPCSSSLTLHFSRMWRCVNWVRSFWYFEDS